MATDALIVHGVNLLRFDANERAEIIAILQQLEKELLAKLARTDLTDIGRRDANTLLKQAQATIAEYYGKIADHMDASLLGLGNVEAQHTVSILDAAVNAAVSVQLPTSEFFKQMLKTSLIQGAPSANWWSRQAGDLAFRFAAQVRQGLAAAETNAQIIQRIRGSRTGAVGIMETSYRNAAALVQTSVQQIANAARLETFRQNDDVVKGVQQLSTLDSHTTVICIAYSGGQWDLEGSPINGTTLPFNGGPPRHWNCRSVLIPITATFKELGLDIPEAELPNRPAEGGAVPGNTTFKEWLDKKPQAFVDNLLGVGKADLFRKGKITLRDLLDQSGRPLTLEQLRATFK